MIRIQCQKCGTKYRVAREKITARTVRVRCGRCQFQMVIAGPPNRHPRPAGMAAPHPSPRPPVPKVTRQVRTRGRRLRGAKRRSSLRSFGKGLVVGFILLVVGLGGYLMTTTPGISWIYAVLFIALNGLVWGLFAARDRSGHGSEAPASS